MFRCHSHYFHVARVFAVIEIQGRQPFVISDG